MMRPQLIRLCLGFVALALPASARHAVAMDALPSSTAGALAQAVSPQAIAEDRPKLKEYQDGRAAFEAEAAPYWTSTAERRRGRNANRRDRQPTTLNDYVLPPPPLYTGPKRPVDPSPEP